MRALLGHGEMYVVETDDEAFLGFVEVAGDSVVIRSGFVGRPVLLDLADVVRITPARDHEDVDL
jgi:hypothetical protein